MSHARRVFLEINDALLNVGAEISVPSEEAHHLKNVLRLTPGAAVTGVVKESGREFEGIISSLDNGVLLKVLSITNKNSSKKESSVATLIFCLGKNPVNDLVCEKAGELGVRNLLFWQSERSVIQIEPSDYIKKISRWNKIAESAAKQSGKSFIMETHLATTTAELLSALAKFAPRSERRFCCSLTPSAVEVGNLREITSPSHIIVGPAGDFTSEEEELLIREGFELISLGANLLRSETAAIAAIAMIQAVSKYGRY